MPRVSNRKKALRAVRRRVELALLLQSSSSDEDNGCLDFELPGFDDFDQNKFTSDSSECSLPLDSSTDSDQGYSDFDERPETLMELYFVMYHTRFLAPRKISNKSMEFRQHFFHILDDSLFWQVTQMNKNSFYHLLEKIEAHPAFHNKACPQQTPIESQLAVCLDHLGHDGNGACLAHMIPTWGISVGSIVNFSKRCFRALEDVLKNSIEWPSRAERQVISGEFAKRGFPGCVGLIDGSLMPLSQRPHISGECYWTRKCRYAINVQVVCDHRRKISHMFSGMPGSCSDLTCTRKSPVWDYLADVHPNILFDADQYILGDSGYQCLPHMVSAFKRTDTNAEKVNFNTCVAKARVTNEHCIGVLKQRWHSLKAIRVQLNARKDSTWMVRWITLCGKLHNYVIDQNDPWTADDVAVDQHEPGPGPEDDDEPDVENPATENTESARVSLRRITTASVNLLDRVMAIALDHHRQPGGFLNSGQ